MHWRVTLWPKVHALLFDFEFCIDGLRFNMFFFFFFFFNSVRENALTGRRRLRINNFSSHVRDSAEYATLVDHLLKAQLTKEYKGTHEIILSAEQLEQDAIAKKLKEKKNKALLIRELKKVEARQAASESRPATASADVTEGSSDSLVVMDENEGETLIDAEGKEGKGEGDESIDKEEKVGEIITVSITPPPETVVEDVKCLLITRDSMKQVVLGQFDAGARATRLLACAQEWLSVTPEMIAPTEIEEGDTEWNFAFLANLFIAHPTLRTDPIPFVTDHQGKTCFVVVVLL